MIDLVRLHHVSFRGPRPCAIARVFWRSGRARRDPPAGLFPFPGAWFAVGDRQLHLIQESGGLPREVGERISRSDHMALEVRDIEAVRTTLEDAGIDYQCGGNEALGFSQVFCSDPDDHTIEFVRYS